MNCVSTDKYTVAWFKLADVIARGEKERALGVYRLLSHSFDDAAFALQLEGDILWAFNDERAASKYEMAARLYFQQGRKHQAVAVYEHIVSMVPDKPEYVTTLVEWCDVLNLKDKHVIYGLMLFNVLCKQKEYAAALLILNRLEDDSRLLIDAYQQYIIAVIPRCEPLDRDVLCYIKKVVDWGIAHNDQSLLQSFFIELEAVHEEYYLAACQYLEEEVCV